MKKKQILVFSLIVTLVIAAGLFFGQRSILFFSEGKNADQQIPSSLGKGIVMRGLPKMRTPGGGKRTARISRDREEKPKILEKPILDLMDDDEDEDRTPAERALAARIEKALDEEDFKLAVDCAKEALTCHKKAIRGAMVETLGWFGVKALPELTPFMADPDDEIRSDAEMEWAMALSEIEDDTEKISTVEMAMKVLSDEEMLDDISSEYIGVDEKLAVESLLRIIEGRGSEEGITKAKETYEFVTGEEFTNRADAEKWIAEEYEPPENDEEKKSGN